MWRCYNHFVKVPFNNLKKHFKPLKKDILKRLAIALDECQFTFGSETEQFEESFSHISGVKYNLAVKSGTAALVVALKAAGIGPGDEVITTPVTFVATTHAIMLVGAKPVLPTFYQKQETLIQRN